MLGLINVAEEGFKWQPLKVISFMMDSERMFVDFDSFLNHKTQFTRLLELHLSTREIENL